MKTGFKMPTKETYLPPRPALRSGHSQGHALAPTPTPPHFIPVSDCHSPQLGSCVNQPSSSRFILKRFFSNCPKDESPLASPHPQNESSSDMLAPRCHLKAVSAMVFPQKPFSRKTQNPGKTVYSPGQCTHTHTPRVTSDNPF